MLRACDLPDSMRCMNATRWSLWVDRLISPDTPARAAERAGFDRSAFTRWGKGASADPAFAVKLARAYGASPIEALTAAELITDDEAQMRAYGMDEALALASDAALIEEVRARLIRRSEGPPTGISRNTWARIDPKDQSLIATHLGSDVQELTDASE